MGALVTRVRSTAVNRVVRFLAQVDGGPFDLGDDDYEAWTRDGSPAHRRLIGRVGGHLAVALGAYALVMVAVSGGSAAGRAIGAGIGVFAVVTGLALARWGGHVPLFAMDLLEFSAAALLAFAGRFEGGISVALPGIFVVLGTNVFAVRKWPIALAHTIAFAASYGIVVATSTGNPAPLTRWLVVMTIVLTSGSFVRWLVRNVGELVVKEHDAREAAELASAELVTVSRAKSQFLARMSHELRTPLNAILGFAEVLRDQLAGPLTARQLEYVTDISESGRHLLGLVDEVLDLSKVESGAVALDVGPLAVQQAVDDAATMVRERAAVHGIDLRLHVERGLAPIEADGRKVRQVLVNLLANAVKFTPPGGRVAVRAASRPEGGVKVEVEDTGVGIAPDDHERIFEQFEQVAGVSEGTGLGLPLARRFIELHGGRLWVESEPGRGSTFVFELPDRPAHHTAPPVAEEEDLERELGKYAGFVVEGSQARYDYFTSVGRWLAAVAGVVLPVAALITPGDVVDRAAVAAVGLVALVISIGFRNHYPRVTRRAGMSVVPMAGAVAITLLAWAVGDFSDVTALVYGWITLISFTMWEPSRMSALPPLLALIGVGYGAVLVQQGQPNAFAQWLGVLVYLLLNGILVRWVLVKLQRLVVGEHNARRTAEQVRAALSETSQHKSDFLASMSHELRTPLNARQEDYVDDVLDSGRHLLALINDILDLARLEAGQLQLSSEPVVVAALVERSLGLVAAEATERAVTIVSEPVDDRAVVVGDHHRLEQVVVNLLSNAVKFSRDGGEVRLRTSASGDELRLEVHDSGIGIHPAQRRSIFEAFSQGSGLPEPAPEGTGLGLALAKGLVELHGGRIWVESEPGVGSTFTVVLPLTADIDLVGQEA